MKKKLIIGLISLIVISAIVVVIICCVHHHEYSDTVVLPTCTERGYTLHKCSCGESYIDNYTEANGHNFDSPIYEWSQDYKVCSATRVCLNDGTHIESETVVSKQEIIQIGSCVLPELSNFVANFDNSAFSIQIKEEIQTADKLGHLFLNYIGNSDATCVKDGTKTAKCERCDVVNTIIDENSKLGHDYSVINTAPTCVEKGYTTYTCNVCGDSYVGDYINALNHSFTKYISDGNATCSKDGTKTAKCDRCEAKDTIIDVGTKLVHEYKLQIISEKYLKSPANCKQKAIYYYSCQCGEFGIRTFEYGDYGAHNYIDGVCSVCGNKLNTKEKLYKRIDENGNESLTGNFILFGEYPQTDVTSLVGESLSDYVISLPSNENSNGWISYKYFISGSNSEDFMWFKDVDTDSNGTMDYRAVYFSSYRPDYTSNQSSSKTTYQGKNKYNVETVYWFKYESVKWRILNESDGKATIVAEIILDSQNYNYTKDNIKIGSEEICGNNYEHSSIRAWLNEDFYNTTFNSLQKEIINLIEIDNSVNSTNPNSGKIFNEGINEYTCANTMDRIWLLSEQEVTKEDFGFFTDSSKEDEARQKKVSSYAKCMGAYVDKDNDCGLWWLRSPYYLDGGYAWNVNSGGSSENANNVFYTYYGVVPAIQISLLDVKPHEHEYNKAYALDKYLKESSTCNKKAVYYYSCECGEKGELTFEYGDLSNHLFIIYLSNNDATCVSNGTKTAYCEYGCGNTDTIVDENSQLSHDYKSVVTAPTCNEQGYTTYTCSRCKESYVDDYVNAINHDYGEWEIIEEATEEKSGLKRRVCKNDSSHIEEEIIPKLGHVHNFIETVVKPTCFSRGYTEYKCYCENSFVDNYVDIVGHLYVKYISNNDATCVSNGTKTAYCEYGCGNTDTIVDENSQLLHDYKSVVTAPTCTEQGYTTYTCISCGDSYIDDYVNATNHDYGEWEIIEEATEEKSGLKRRVCKNDSNHIEEEIIPPIGHIHNYVKTIIRPTCTEQGYTLYECSCGDSYKDNKVDALNHDYENPIYNWSEDYYTCTATRVCKNDSTHTETETVDTVGKLVQEKSCVLDELVQYTATFTNIAFESQMSENIKTAEKRGHIYNKQVVLEKYLKEEATCKAKATYYYSCECGEAGNNTFITGEYASHNYVEGVCSICGDKQNKKIGTYERIDSEGEESSSGKYIYFGTYPQEDVTNTMGEVLNDYVGAMPTKDDSNGWISYGFYTGKKNTNNFMWYMDIEYNGNKYRAVYFVNYRQGDATLSSSLENSYQDDNGYYINNIYWFKYENIKWKILSEEDGKAIVIADLILDSQQYDYDGNYSNNYANSTIRKWLNEDFYNTAFTEMQKEIINAYNVDNGVKSTFQDKAYWNYGVNVNSSENTLDKVWLLSLQEATSVNYGFIRNAYTSDSNKQKKATNYAQCMGINLSEEENADKYGCWWYRSPHFSEETGSWLAGFDGRSNYCYSVYCSCYGIVPVLQINL